MYSKFDKISKAISKGDIATLNNLKSSTFPSGVDQIAGEPWLRSATDIGVCGSVKWMIDNGADINVKLEDGHTLITSCLERHDAEKLKIIELLVVKGADINEIGWQGMTPLHYSIELKDTLSAEKLIELGANSQLAVSLDGMGTAVDFAKKRGADIFLNILQGGKT